MNHFYVHEFPPELVSTAAHWFGGEEEEQVTLKKLRGKVVVLQFNF